MAAVATAVSFSKAFMFICFSAERADYVVEPIKLRNVVPKSILSSALLQCALNITL